MTKNILLSWLGCLLVIAAGPSHGAPTKNQVTIIEPHTPSGSAVDSLMTVTATDEFTDCT
jgi:hypothetical protein